MPELRAQPDWAYEFPNLTGPDTQIRWTVLPDWTKSGFIFSTSKQTKKINKKIENYFLIFFYFFKSGNENV